jgi:hypothetical protein
MASETTFSSSRPAVTEYTVKPLLGSSANNNRPPQGNEDGSSLSLVTYALLSLAFVTAIGVASYGARHWANRRRRVCTTSFKFYSSLFSSLLSIEWQFAFNERSLNHCHQLFVFWRWPG